MFLALKTIKLSVTKILFFTDVNDGLAKCLLHVYIDSCHDLKAPTTKKRSSKPSPAVELKVGNGEAQQTIQQYFDNDPVFEQGFVFSVTNPHSDDLHVKILDKGHDDTVIGTTTIITSDIL